MIGIGHLSEPEVRAMQPWLCLPCSRCGARLVFDLRDAGQRRFCRSCQAPIDVPPLGKLVKPRPGGVARPTKDSCFLIWVLGAAAALVLAPTTWWVVQAHQRAKAADRANHAVAAQVEAARMQVSQQRWDEAAFLLQAALATDQATDLQEARALWRHIRGQQAAAMLRAAESTLAQRDAAQALTLLQTYLHDPYGAEHERAERLKEQLEQAISDAEALAHLHRLPYAALAEFAQTGTFADLEGITDPNVRAIYLDKLRGCLAAELQRREEDQSRRGRRIQATPLFGEFQDAVALTRRRLLAKSAGGEIDYRLLARLFRELKVNGAEEQQHIILALSARSLDYGEAEKIARMRSNFKERFRTYKEFDKTDHEIFDWVVDQELNKLLQNLQGPPIVASNN